MALMPPALDLPLPSGDLSRPTRAEVDLARLSANFHAIDRATGPARVMAILKANAYGHGLLPVARHLEAQGAEHFGVALLEEGLQLRQAGIHLPILVLGGLVPDQIPLALQHDLSLTASSIEKLEAIDRAAGTLGRIARVHLEIDTGMERTGVHWYSAGPFLERSLACRNAAVEGVYSHFANADAADVTSARTQYERFMEALQFYERRSLPVPTRHLANSGGILQLPQSHLDMVRAGILLYGVYPSRACRRTIAVQPALSLRSTVAYFKVVEAGAPISYGHTWKSDHRIRVVTVPIGYGDGYPRRLSNSGQVLLRGKRYPIVGRVCMDQLMVSIEWDEAYNGDLVTLLGEDGAERITADDLAGWLDTIAYEVLTGINTRVPRVYLGGPVAAGPASRYNAAQ
ncbi:MAG: alanine racemase [Chloroflexi bacterium]|nr:alanine racemase [Chloroflexota bacterium]